MRITSKTVYQLFPHSLLVNDAWFILHEGLYLSPMVDSRERVEGGIFFALGGARVDGHSFVGQAIENGATVVVMEKKKHYLYKNILSQEVLYILVEDTLQALVFAAQVWRSFFSIPVIGITGSMGKTTTKEILAAIFRKVGRHVCASYGNQNSLIGVSLSVLRLDYDHEMAIFEMGINACGEMDILVDIVRPTTALITTIAHAHIEGLQSFEVIAREKEKIFTYVAADAQLMVGEALIPFITIKEKTIKTFGSTSSADIWFEDFGPDHMQVKINAGGNTFFWQHEEFHYGRLYNRLQAAFFASMQGIALTDALAVAFDWNDAIGRFEQKQIAHGRGIVIDDACNANPESMICAIEAFDRMKCGASVSKILIIGPMYELGAYAQEGHARVLQVIARLRAVEHIIFVNTAVWGMQKSNGLRCKKYGVESADDAFEIVQNLVKEKKCAIFCKASKTVELSKVVAKLCF